MSKPLTSVNTRPLLRGQVDVMLKDRGIGGDFPDLHLTGNKNNKQQQRSNKIKVLLSTKTMNK